MYKDKEKWKIEYIEQGEEKEQIQRIAYKLRYSK